MAQTITPTGVERTFGDDDIIVSKTDLKGRLVYANRVFLDVSGYTEKEVLGEPHSILRHPNMPRCVFKVLWDTIQSGKEIFAYVINLTKSGDHYWVYAHVTPSFDSSGNISGYHSNRRTVDRRIVEEDVIPLYKRLSGEEKAHGNRKEAMRASEIMLNDLLQQAGVAYDEFILTLGQNKRRGYR